MLDPIARSSTIWPTMTCQSLEPNYAVLATKLGDRRGFELRIRELLVIVRSDDLAEGWRLVQARKQEVIDCARSAGLIDELPSPLPPPAG
jgi:hypothetical protein